VTDTLGFMVGLVVHSAGIQDRGGAPEVFKSIRNAHPDLLHVFLLTEVTLAQSCATLWATSVNG